MASETEKRNIWNKAKEARGKDPLLYRRDPYGNIMFYPSYGKSTPMGWEIDHIKPKSRGGSNATVNKQALNTKVNREKSNSLKKKSRHSRSNK